ncbi:hypothetical protein [uncultured Aureimonas sp.]|uniref:hypothetical protein n=1 Tax=uncultured Aureimonas sp. TaxID=1604662 RepID=UPI0025F87270|nr:hypothetical protein [uncultured Aureimonas sp.]
MAEQRGFFRRIFSFGAKEEERIPESGGLPRAQDTTAARPDSTAPEIHQPAMASADVDSEAGAAADEPAGGGITPLRPKDPDGSAVPAEKKTLN